jgi:hypothetical protein
MKIKKIWEELENDQSLQKGLLVRRFNGEVLPDIFIAVQQPEKLLCIFTSVSNKVNVNIDSLANLEEIQVNVFPDNFQPGRNILLFKLINNQHRDIFEVLCEDLISSVSDESNEKKLVRSLLNRFEKWKSLFSKIASKGLTPEEQRGLFGELYFLRKFLQHRYDFEYALNTWIGPSGEIRDFQFNDWALEVKTSLSNNHQRVQISSERQLDNSHVENLFLYHLSLEQSQESGETLPLIITSFYEIIQSDTISLNKFRSKLYDVGYFEKHEELYEKTGYHVRQEKFYKVEGDFPRVQENELRNGVGDVKYSIIISQCSQYIKSENQVLDKLSDR